MDWLGRLIDLFLMSRGEDHDEGGFKPVRWLIAAGGAGWTAYTFTWAELVAKVVGLIDQSEQGF